MLRQALRYLVRLTLLAVLIGLVWRQVWVYHSEPIRTTSSRMRAPFPRLTICPELPAPNAYLLPSLIRLANGSISTTEFYETVTTKLRSKAGDVLYRGRHSYFSDEHGPGLWRERYYFRRRPMLTILLGYTRCITFFPSESLNTHGNPDNPIRVSVHEAPLFKARKRASYRLYVHGDDVPSVGDLPEWAPFTESVPLYSGRSGHFVITARRTERVSVRRRPCSSRPGYSKAQCLKECQWRRLVALANCRLPHMVGDEVFLPKMEGFMDHLPPCSRLLKVEEHFLAVAESLEVPECIKKNQHLNISSLFQDYYRYFEESPFKLDQPEHSSDLRRKPDVPMQAGRHNFTSIPPRATSLPRLPRAIPAPPTAQKNVPLPANAFVNLPNGAYNIYPSSCRCPLACRETTYIVTQKIANDHGVVWNPCVAFLSLTFDFTEEVVSETLTILLTDLLASIGGFMGLFAGVSLYTGAEYIECFVGNINEQMKKWKKGRHCQKPVRKRCVSALSIQDIDN